MATFHDRTLAPRVQRGLLRAFAHSLTRLKSEDTPALGVVPTHDTFEALADLESTARQPCSRKGLRSKEALASTAPDALLPLPALLPSLPAALSRRRAIFGAVDIDEPDTAAQARALHARRELHQALDHGLALMDPLDLSPRGLDPMDRAIAQLDTLEAPDEDLEPWLAGYQNLAELPLDGEDDSEEDEGTSLETCGRGFVRCGADDAEDDDPAERDEDHGSEDEAHPWRRDPSLVAFAVRVAHG